MPVKGESRSVTANARRAQILTATIETIAELGYGQASFARIAERAGLSSTRLISYHFAGKDELISALIADVYADMGRFMAERMADCADARDALATYIRSVVAYIAAHRAQMQALMSVFLGYRSESGASSYDADSEREVLGHLQGILRAGQESGAFRPFDTFVMAATVQRSIDGLPFLLRTAPDLDLEAYAEELAELFDRATRSAP
ncbi:TetR/AcrR family transcriptional regulator [Streptacidiphilus rugosus]|uniref:TetR/AcrR family transcriptional regulator n=1 Tax=Streptacidiphilus rugosus TaxID=405783 RepID=UPI00055D2D5D|nr:TetR/AcrR family transcriptional regulator [Streptacidiphilus rugosus]